MGKNNDEQQELKWNWLKLVTEKIKEEYGFGSTSAMCEHMGNQYNHFIQQMNGNRNVTLKLLSDIREHFGYTFNAHSPLELVKQELPPEVRTGVVEIVTRISFPSGSIVGHDSKFIPD